MDISVRNIIRGVMYGGFLSTAVFAAILPAL